MRINLILNTPLENVQEDAEGYYVQFEDSQARLPPHYGAQNFQSNEVISLLFTAASSVALNVLSSYIYDTLKNKKAKRIDINDTTVSTENSIEEINTILTNELKNE